MWFYFPLAENIDNKDLIKNFFTWAWVKVSSHYHRGKRVTIPIPRISWYFLIWDPFTSYFYVVLKQSFILIHAHSESIHITICCFISSNFTCVDNLMATVELFEVTSTNRCMYLVLTYYIMVGEQSLSPCDYHCYTSRKT